MSEEKMAILRMLETGKINAEEASKLLSAIASSSTAEESPMHSSSTRGESESAPAATSVDSHIPHSNRAGVSTDKWVSDVTKKIATVAKDLEPKIQKIAGAAISKTVTMADKATKSIQSHMAASSTTSPSAVTTETTSSMARTSAATPFGSSKDPKRKFDYLVVKGQPNTLALKTPKGTVNVTSYNGDKLTVKYFAKSKSADATADFVQLGASYQMNCDLDKYESIDIEALIPANYFHKIYINANNSEVNILGISAGQLSLDCEFSKVALNDSNVDNVSINNVNGVINVANLVGDKLLIDNSGAPINLNDIDVSILSVESSSSPVNCISRGFYKYSDYAWNIQTSNSDVTARLPIAGDTGYKVKAYTSLNEVSVSLDNFNYSVNDKNLVEGKTQNYLSCYRKVLIDIETSNACVKIN